MSRQTVSLHLELVCVACSGGQPDENGASTICALCSIGETTPVVEVIPAAPQARRRKKPSPELLCISCSGGRKNTNGDYTVCVLCADTGEDPLPAAA